MEEEESKSRKNSDNLIQFTIEAIKPEEKPHVSMDFDFPVVKIEEKPKVSPKLKDPFDFAALEDNNEAEI